VNCPLCSFAGPPRALHAHLGDAHPDLVRFEERAGRSFYAITCPVCGEGYEHQIKPRGRDAGFVEEFAAQIRLVAFDMLVSHLMGEHGEHDLDGLPEARPEEAPAPPGAVAGPAPAWLVEARRRAADRSGDTPDPGVGDPAT
jgi:hypothetical protein